MTTSVALLPGDGVGPEVVAEARRAVDALGLELDWKELPWGSAHWHEHGRMMPDDWREALRTWAGMIRDAYRAHPWVLEIPRGQLSVLMPASVRAADLGLAALSGLDLADDEKIAAILLISQHVVSMVELERSLAAEGGPVVTPEGAEALREVVTAEHYPHLAPVMTRGGYIADGEGAEPESVDDEYEFGLDMLIAGLESLARRRGAA